MSCGLVGRREQRAGAGKEEKREKDRAKDLPVGHRACKKAEGSVSTTPPPKENPGSGKVGVESAANWAFWSLVCCVFRGSCRHSDQG
jgi:hypothetical protein